MVRCNMCLWKGEEKDLERGQDIEGSFDGCPTCNTDSYLTNLEEPTKAYKRMNNELAEGLEGNPILEELKEIERDYKTITKKVFSYCDLTRKEEELHGKSL